MPVLRCTEPDGTGGGARSNIPPENAVDTGSGWAFACWGAWLLPAGAAVEEIASFSSPSEGTTSTLLATLAVFALGLLCRKPFPHPLVPVRGLAVAEAMLGDVFLWDPIAVLATVELLLTPEDTLFGASSEK